MINRHSAFSFNSIFSAKTPNKQIAVSIPFFKDNLPLTDKDDKNFPKAYLSIKDGGSMRYRINEPNPNRDIFFTDAGFAPKSVVPIELIHSKAVINLVSGKEASKIQGDGLLTINKSFIPAITVADCVPVYFYDPVTNCFGVVHSGWKGTGIILEALKLANQKYKAKVEDFLIIIGPHIHNCCYTVNKERADFFANTFSTDCVTEFSPELNLYNLSLAKANIHLLTKAGVKEENILECSDCTNCDTRLGSFRRETLPYDLSETEKPDGTHFTPMTAFVAW